MLHALWNGWYTIEIARSEVIELAGGDIHQSLHHLLEGRLNILANIHLPD